MSNDANEGRHGTLVHRQRTPQGAFDVYEPTQPIRERFADGYANILIGPEVSRVSFFTVAGVNQDPNSPQPVEDRIISERVVIPTRALVEFCVQTLENLAISHPLLEQVRKDSDNVMAAAAKRLK